MNSRHETVRLSTVMMGPGQGTGSWSQLFMYLGTYAYSYDTPSFFQIMIDTNLWASSGNNNRSL